MKLEIVDLDLQHPGVLASYIVETGDSLLVFDPGPASTLERMLGILSGKQGKKIYVFITHVHLDHAGGVGHLVGKVKVSGVFVHERGVKHLVNPEYLWSQSLKVLGETAASWGKPKPVEASLIEGLKGGEKVEVESATVMTVNCEGHASHQLCYFLEDGTLFPGDALGEVYSDNILLLTPPPFMAGEAVSTIDRIIKLKPQRYAIPHFGVYPGSSLLPSRYKAKLLKALCAAARTTGNDVEALARHIYEDPEIQRAINLLSSRHRELAGEVLRRTAQGLLGYVESFGWQCT